MAGKVVLHYFNGRGKMESIRWLLTVAEVEVSEGCGDVNLKALLSLRNFKTPRVCPKSAL